MLHLNARLRFYFRERLKMYKNVEEKMDFMLHLMIHWIEQSRVALEGTLGGTLNDALSNLHKVMLHLRVHLTLHLGCTCDYPC